MEKPVKIVTISKIIPIYKNDEEANSINLVNFIFDNGDECGYNVISQKGLYDIGSKAVFIEPDYSLSDIALFDSFTRPNGEPKKSKLGKNNRIRAIKFNFSLANSSDPIYSFGILLPKSEVDSFIGRDCDVDDISEILGVTKYEEPESGGSGLITGDLPSFLYKTDETNINSLKSKVHQVCDGFTELGLTIKRDGSSITVYFKKIGDEYKVGVCSRGQEKNLDQKQIVQYVDDSNNIFHRYINPETKEKGWFCDLLSEFKTNDGIINMTPISVDVKDSWVELSNKCGLLEKGLEFCKRNNLELAFRGEIYGQGLKGSGNKYNPDSNSKQSVIFFGVDDLSEGFSRRINYSSKYNLQTICEELGLEYTKPIVVKPSSYMELTQICEDMIKSEKDKGRIIEGIVIRTHQSNVLSCKYMNSYYDSVK